MVLIQLCRWKFSQKKLRNRVYSIEVDLLKKRKNRFLSHPLGHLGVTYALHLWLVWKRVGLVDFIFVVIELFLLSPTVETLWAEIGWSRRFSKGVGHFERRFQRDGASPTNHCWYQSSSVIALSCGIRISAVRHLVFSQCTRVTDGQTDRRTDEQNYDSRDRRSICSRGKNLLLPEICVEDIVILIGRDIHTFVAFCKSQQNLLTTEIKIGISN